MICGLVVEYTRLLLLQIISNMRQQRLTQHQYAPCMLIIPHDSSLPWVKIRFDSHAAQVICRPRQIEIAPLTPLPLSDTVLQHPPLQAMCSFPLVSWPTWAPSPPSSVRSSLWTGCCTVATRAYPAGMCTSAVGGAIELGVRPVPERVQGGGIDALRTSALPCLMS